MKRAIVFVDANNWYHNIKHWFTPSDIDICKIVDLIAKERDLSVVEIRWYASIPNIEDNKLNYIRHMDFLSSLRKRKVKVISRKLQKLSNKELKRRRHGFMGSLDLCNVCKPIIEESFLDISDHSQKEKGIDVWAAVDIVRKSIIERECDVCILISGDADFVPALELVRKQNKEVLSVFVPRGYSNELRQKFPYLILNKDRLNKCFRKYQRGTLR